MSSWDARGKAGCYCERLARRCGGGLVASFCPFPGDTLSGSGTETPGVALMNMVRNLGLEARAARKVERAPAEVVEDALARLQTILE
ncbi:hypothetical protein QFZ97_005035 [Paraburkholderia youngii]